MNPINISPFELNPFDRPKKIEKSPEDIKAQQEANYRRIQELYGTKELDIDLASDDGNAELSNIPDVETELSNVDRDIKTVADNATSILSDLGFKDTEIVNEVKTETATRVFAEVDDVSSITTDEAGVELVGGPQLSIESLEEVENAVIGAVILKKYAKNPLDVISILSPGHIRVIFGNNPSDYPVFRNNGNLAMIGRSLRNIPSNEKLIGEGIDSMSQESTMQADESVENITQEARDEVDAIFTELGSVNPSTERLDPQMLKGKSNSLDQSLSASDYGLRA